MEDYEIPSLLKKIHDRMKANFDAELKSLGLTFGQMRAMYVLEKNGGQLTRICWTSRIRRLSES